MNQFIALLSLLLLPSLADAKGRIQNEDIKSLSDITSAVLSTTGNLTSGNACITSLGSTSGLATGIFVYDTTNSTYIPSGTTIVGLPGTCSAGQVQMSANATHAATGDTITFGGQGSQLINDSKIWLTTLSPAQQLSTAITSGAIGGGGGGSKNYLSPYTASTSAGVANIGNGNFEQGSTSGWSLGTVGTLTNGIPSGSPTFGSGASGNLSITAVSSGQIAGNYSLSYASSAATTQGNMVASNAFFIDTEDQAKMLTAKFYYSVFSGGANDNFSGTSSNSFSWAVYDVTNSAWLGSQGHFCMTQSSGTGYCTGTFQTASTTQQLRFVMYNANATSGATTIYFDDFSVGPQTAPFGPAMTDWQPYTVSITGSTSNPTKGTTTQDQGYWRRVGDSVEVSYDYIQTAAGSAGSGDYIFSLPSGLVMDTAKLFAGNPTANGRIGIAGLLTGGSEYPGNVVAHSADSTTGVVISYESALGTPLIVGSANAPLSTTATRYSLNYKLPIVGWSSNSVMSSDSDTRVISSKANMITAGQTVTTSLAAIALNNIPFDTTGSMSGSGVYTVPVTGFYQVGYNMAIIAGGSATALTAGVQDNAATNYLLTSLTSVTSGKEYPLSSSGIIKLNAGQTLTLVAKSTTGSSTTDFANDLVMFSVQRVSGPSVIAATESVNMKYNNTAGTSITSSAATVPFATKVYDSHNAFNTSTNVYTVPVSGKYVIRGGLYTQNVTNSTTQAFEMIFLVTSTPESLSAAAQSVALVYGNGSAIQAAPSTSKTYQMNAGDTFAIQADSPNTVSLSTTAGRNYIAIERVGN